MLISTTTALVCDTIATFATALGLVLMQKAHIKHEVAKTEGIVATKGFFTAMWGIGAFLEISGGIAHVCKSSKV